MGERHFARARIGSTAHDGGVRDRVMRRTEGRPAEQAARRKCTCRRMYGGYLKELVLRKCREYSRECASEHGLAGTGRAIEDEIMPTRGRYLKRALGTFLSLHIPEVDCRRTHIWQWRAFCGHELLLTADVFDYLPQTFSRIDLYARYEKRFEGVSRRHEYVSDTFLLRSYDLCDRAAHAAERSIEPELTRVERGSLRKSDISGCSQVSERQRQVIVRAFLLEVSRREREDDAFIRGLRRLETGVAYGA